MRWTARCGSYGAVRSPRWSCQAGLPARVYSGLESHYLVVAQIGVGAVEVPQPPRSTLMTGRPRKSQVAGTAGRILGHRLPGPVVGSRPAVEAGADYRAVEVFAGWVLRDPLGRRIGRVRRVFLDGAGLAAHVEVALGSFGTRTVLLPVGDVAADHEGRVLTLGEGRRRSASGHGPWRAPREG